MIPHSYIKEENLINNYGYIYMLVNTATNKAYIGKKYGTLASKTFYIGSSPALVDDIRIYGKDSIKRYIITEGFFSKAFLNELEKHYIQLYGATQNDMFYNKSSGSDDDFIAAQKASAASQAMTIVKLDKNLRVIKQYSKLSACAKDSKSCASTIVKYARNKKWNEKDKCYFSITNYRKYKSITNYYESTCAVFIPGQAEKIQFNSVHDCARHFEVSVTTIVKCFKKNWKILGKYNIEIHEIPFERSVGPLKKGKRSIILYNSSEELLFESCSKAAEFLKNKYNIKPKSNLIAMLSAKLRQINPKYKDFYIKENPINHEEEDSCTGF